MFSSVTTFVLAMMVSSINLESTEDEIISYCQIETKRFTEYEQRYCDELPDYLNEAVITKPDAKELQLDVYAKVTRQRVFECITYHMDEESQLELESNEKYQALVNNCKSEQFEPSCNATFPYRTINATCNNLLNTNWGAVNCCFRRLMTGHYEGAAGFRQSVCGGPLPEPRFLSLNINENKYLPTTDFNHMLTFYAQLVAHDTTSVDIFYVKDQYMDCCTYTKEEQHPECDPIYLEEDDPFYSKFNLTCFNLIRSASCDTCSVGKRNQMNGKTSYIDLSFVYGITDSEADSLRTKSSGKMISQERCEEELLPPNKIFGFCGSEKRKEYCFLSGDNAVNFGIPSMGLQTLFWREHNRIAENLNEINPCWNDEMIYQETRKINIAQMQVIAYKELVPLLTGSDRMSQYQLWIQDESCTAYDPTVDASLVAEFTTAAFRLHMLINPNLTDHSLNSYDNQIRHSENNVGPYYRGKMDAVMEGMCTSPAQKYSRFVTVDMTDFLLRTGTGKYGLDIASVHIQRGRDNGLPTYAEMVRYLSNGTIDIQSFDDLDYFIDSNNIELLKSIYCDVQDIDLWIGMMNERVEDTLVVGPTAAEVIAIQFNYWKFGDRFYFEHCGNFDDAQLETLRNTSLSSLLCVNTDIQSIQSKALLFPSENNPNQMCGDLPKLDLSRWKADCSNEGS